MVNKSLCFALLLVTLLFGQSAHATNYPISAGASQSTIQSTINTAAAASGANTVSFAAGTYSVATNGSCDSTGYMCAIYVRCPSGSLVITGPSNNYATGANGSWNSYPTATLSNTATGTTGPFFVVESGCSNVSISYLEMQGNHPYTGGGGVILAGSNSNIYIRYNYVHGMQTYYPIVSGTSPNQSINVSSDTNASSIYLAGGAGSTSTNIYIQYNRIGNPSNPGSNDCSNMMTWVGSLVNGKFFGYDQSGGACGTMWQSTNLTNLYIENNVFSNIEEGIKGVEHLGNLLNVHYDHNDLGYIHHSYHETQMLAPTQSQPSDWSFNDEHDQYVPSFSTWANSTAQNYYSNIHDSLDITNYSNSVYSATIPGYEFWGNGLAYNNLSQGNRACQIEFYTSGPPMNIHDSTIESPNNPCSTTMQSGQVWYGVQSEGEPGQTPANYPLISNMVFTHTISTVTSTAPSISPACYPTACSFSGSQTITITDNGITTPGLPNGNTTIWYTTDGTTPAPQSGTSTGCATPCQFTITSNTTVKAVGMWGSITQPASYPSGYGFVPSATVTSVYTNGGSPTAATPMFSPATESFTGTISVSISDSTPGSTIYYTTNGSTPTTSSPVYTTPIGIAATTTINAIAAATGYVTSNVGTGVYTLTTPGQAATPTFSPTSQTFNGTLSVSISDSTPSPTIYYTTDGSVPTTSSTVYSGPITVSSTTTVNAIATASGYTQSAIGTATYTYLLYLGNNLENVSGSTYPNAFNSVYAVTGTNPGGYNITGCVLNQGGGTVTSGANTDCLVTLATSPTAQQTSALCHGTWTNPSTVGTTAGNITMSGCPILGPGVAYWVSTITNDTLAPSALGMWNCGGSCSSTVPTSGNGAYYGYFFGGTYGSYTSLTPTLQQGLDQASQYLTLSAASSPAAAPSISPAGSSGNTSPITVTITDSSPTPTIYYTTNGSTPTTSSTVYTGAFTVSATSTVNAIATSPGYTTSPLATPQTYTFITTPTLTSVFFSVAPSACTNCVLPGGTAQFYMNFVYNSSTAACPSTYCTVNNVIGVPDIYGNSITSLSSSNTSIGTISNSGLFTGASCPSGQTGCSTLIIGAASQGFNAYWIESLAQTLSSGIAGGGIQ